ncbi:hypothetical protein VHEMI00716 [[Torrubiella] hemipterigena]|uniref:Secreted protein n=1 Tax=[Torrubiella] hemipterigena TaxID=1531966 RepID=A0A0A1T2Q5_9HYPO|nr:hypothetical protein VHEMI00716 [[Torrubiella] hemipterigena]
MKFTSFALFTAVSAVAPKYTLNNWDEPYNATEHAAILAKRNDGCSADANGKTCLHIGNEQINTAKDFSKEPGDGDIPEAFTNIWESFHERCSASPCDKTKKCFEENGKNYCVVWDGSFIGDVDPLYQLMRRNFDKTVSKDTDKSTESSNPGCGKPVCGPPLTTWHVHHNGPSFVGTNHRDNDGGDNVLTMTITEEAIDGDCPKWVELIGDAAGAVPEFGGYFSAAIGVVCGLIGA